MEVETRDLMYKNEHDFYLSNLKCVENQNTILDQKFLEILFKTSKMYKFTDIFSEHPNHCGNSTIDLRMKKELLTIRFEHFEI